MKTIKLFILVTIIACFIQSCHNKTNTVPSGLTGIIYNDCGSYVPYEINPLDKNDTINRMFYDGTKIGHWIVFQWIYLEDDLQNGTVQKPVRAKLEEGNYANGKKEGFWKKYRTDGTFRDSVLYSKGEPGC